MTTSHYDKVLTQIKSKTAKLKRFKKYNAPKERSCGRTNHKCKRCGRTGIGGNIKKYGLNICRCCFREIATKLGFKKYS
ncbi:30S ribosomal protein S14 [Candidatus Woesearchaeota archaeon]|nr:30S ribosomal protein S14 [Candidatus Woesearchaeota archaeon]